MNDDNVRDITDFIPNDQITGMQIADESIHMGHLTPGMQEWLRSMSRHIIEYHERSARMYARLTIFFAVLTVVSLVLLILQIAGVL